MAKGIGQIHVRRQHGLLVVTGFGSTNRGQKFIRQEVPLTVKSPRDPKFKEELATAVEKLLANEGSNTP